jgi:outer membrane protein TolC
VQLDDYDPNNPRLHAELAWAYLEANQFGKAIKSFETGSSSLLEVATALKSVFTTEEQLLQIRNQLMQSKFYIQYLISNP